MDRRMDGVDPLLNLLSKSSKMVDVSVKNLFDISVNTGHICIEFELDKLEKIQNHVHLIRLSILKVFS